MLAESLRIHQKQRDLPQDDESGQVAHVQPSGHLLEVVAARVAAVCVKLPVLLQPWQALRRVVRPLLCAVTSTRLAGESIKSQVSMVAAYDKSSALQCGLVEALKCVGSMIVRQRGLGMPTVLTTMSDVLGRNCWRYFGMLLSCSR